MARSRGFRTIEFHEVWVDGVLSEIRLGPRIVKCDTKYGAIYSYFNMTRMGIMREFFAKNENAKYKEFRRYWERYNAPLDMLPHSSYFRSLKAEIKRGNE